MLQWGWYRRPGIKGELTLIRVTYCRIASDSHAIARDLEQVLRSSMPDVPGSLLRKRAIPRTFENNHNWLEYPCKINFLALNEHSGNQVN